MAVEDAQARLVAWIWAQPGAQPPAGLGAVGNSLDHGLSAYREHAKALAVRALASHCPRLAAWLGEAEFAGLAWAFARAHPPRGGDVNRWGSELPAWLATLPGMDAEPPSLAALDLGLHDLLVVADEAEPDDQLWALLQSEPAERLRLRIKGRPLPLAASLQRHLSDAETLDWPTPPSASASASAWLWRRGWRPCWAWLADDLACLLKALQQAPQLATAVEQTLVLHPELNLGRALRLAWSQGWLLGAERL